MKRMLSIILLLSAFVCLRAQEKVSIKEFLSRKLTDETVLSVKAVYVDVIDRHEGIDFLVKDETGEMPVRLSKNGLRTELVFRSMDIRPGDTLTIVGFRGRVPVSRWKNRKGMISGNITSKVDSPEHGDVFYRIYPSFDGKGYDGFTEWVNEHLVYPYDMAWEGKEGAVTLSFTIEKDGRVTDVTVKESSGRPALDEEALRVVSQSPNWIPGMENGEPTKVEIEGFPIHFMLSRRPIGK